MPPGRVDDEQITAWALAAQAGNRDAAADFVRATQPSVYRFVAHLVNSDEAGDLAQETFLRAMRALPHFAARSSARTWLLSIARRVAADHIRTIQRRPRTVAGHDWQTHLEQFAEAHRGDNYSALLQLLEELPTERREAFVATQLLGLSYAEAADVCDCPVGTIRSRVARARQDLIAALHPTELREDNDSAMARRLSG